MSRRTTTDPKALSREQRIKAARVYRNRQDLRKVLGTEEGRRVLQWIIEEGGIFRNLPIGSAQTMVSEGERQLALKVRATVKDIDVAYLAVMEAEYAALPEPIRDADATGGTAETPPAQATTTDGEDDAE